MVQEIWQKFSPLDASTKKRKRIEGIEMNFIFEKSALFMKSCIVVPFIPVPPFNFCQLRSFISLFICQQVSSLFLEATISL